MAIFTKNRVMNGGIILLVIVNIGVLVTLGLPLFRRPPGEKPAQQFLQDELHLTDGQIRQMEDLKTLYQGKMKILDDDIRTLKEAILAEVFRASPDAENVARFAEQIGTKYAELERLRFQHFLALKSLFQPEQAEKFQSLMRDILRPPAPPDAERRPEQNRPPRPGESPDQRKPPRPDEPPRPGK